MATTNTDFLPNTTGLNLGSPDQQWDGFFNDLSVTNLIAGVNITTGNATSLQGVPIDPTVPLPTQVLEFDGADWAPAFQDSNATSLQGFPVAVNTPAVNQALVWNGAAWIPTNQTGGGGGGGLQIGYVAVPFSVTPVFTPNPSPSSCTFSITLASDVTSSTFDATGIDPGTPFNFILIQDIAGGHTFSWPVECLGTQFIGTTPLQTTVQNFVWTGTNLIATGFPAVF